jgi:hypothetical protein
LGVGGLRIVRIQEPGIRIQDSGFRILEPGKVIKIRYTGGTMQSLLEILQCRDFRRGLAGTIGQNQKSG